MTKQKGKKDNYLLLAKIHRAEYINDMYENEYLYFSSLKEFRNKTKDPTGRRDPKELNMTNTQLKTLTIRAKGKVYEMHNLLEKFSGQHSEFLSEPKINCCSLHWIEIPEANPTTTYNEKLINMGDRMLIIMQLERFFVALDNAIKNQGLEFSRKKVKYYNPKRYDGKLSLHHKDSAYEYQNEYRILIGKTDNKPMKIKIPGLKEMGCVINTEQYKGLSAQVR